MLLLVTSFLALAVGPLIVWLARRHTWSTVLIDAFCLIAVAGFALLHVLPECALQAGFVALPLAVVGFLLPSFAERALHARQSALRPIVITLAMLGLGAHTVLDGFFLTEEAAMSSHGHSHQLTAWAIILHRIPAGIGIWWIVPRTLGIRAAILLTTIVFGGTLVGYYLGTTFLDSTSQYGLAVLQALLAGSLLHVVLHAHIPAPEGAGGHRLASVVGAGVAGFALWHVIHFHGKPGELGPGGVFLRLAFESAPALLFAYLLVGLCHAFLPTNWLRHLTTGPTVLQAIKGVAVGLPLPVCSCGVVPIYRELVRQGSGIAAALAFLVATPELELAAFTLTWQLMGAEVALARIAMAAALALFVAVLVSWLLGERNDAPSNTEPATDTEPREPLGARLRRALQFGFGPAVDSTASWILAGLLLSALLVPYIDRDWIAALPPGIDVPIAALIGLPIYVCATGSTPLAALLLFHGLSPGAVLAFLLTGPATNITTFGVLRKLHGTRAAIAFALAMWGGAIGLGHLVNWLLPTPVVAALTPEGGGHGTVSKVFLGLLGAVFVWSLLRQGVRPFLQRLFESPAGHDHPEGDGHGHSDGHDHGTAGSGHSCH
ncbi:MAG: permease [bacterium]|nr:permease [bacterium]